MTRALLLALLTLLTSAGKAAAEEGMWTFDNFPRDRVAKEHDFPISDQWLGHVMRSAARLRGCSASFVSADGLVATNHHCVASCVQQVSSKARDLMASGFYARSAAEELRCPEIDVRQLLEITDVTARMKEATRDRSGAEYQKARKQAQATLEKECQTSEGLECEVVSLYRGGVYDLYRYRRFADVHLVFAPEKVVAFFGGDPDNFTFPRYDLDVAFLRVYDGGKPAHLDDHLRFSTRAAGEGELVFVAGNPGATSRQLTVAQLAYLRDVAVPETIERLAELRGLLTEFSRRGPEPRRTAETTLFGVENGLKAWRGRWQTLADPAVFGNKTAAEQAFRQRFIRDPQVSKAFADIERAQQRLREIHLAYYHQEQAPSAQTSRLLHIARTLLRAGAERPLPNATRLEEYRDAALPALQQRLFSTAPIYDDVERLVLTQTLSKMREELGPDDPFVHLVLGQQSPEELANRLVAGTRLRDLPTRRKLWEGGAAAVETAARTDALLAFARLIDQPARAIRKTWETEVDAVVRKSTEVLATARFTAEGTKVYPDATSTLRLSFGTVNGWTEKGKTVPPTTTFAGLFTRVTGRPPFALPDRWKKAQSKLTPEVPLDVATSNDIIGGNSGSPLIDRAGEQVGIIFDSNLHFLGGDYVYDPALDRAVSVQAVAVREALAKVFGAGRLLDELDR
jgi:hypothetical protein